MSRRIARMLIGIVTGLLLMIGAVALVGARLPVQHTARVEGTFATSPESLYAIISDAPRLSTWRTGVTRVDVEPPSGGRERYREVSGRDAILYEVELAIPGAEYRTRIADVGLPYGGAWHWQLERVPEGTRLRVTEHGEVHNPLFRFVSRYITGHTATLEAYLRDLGAEVARRGGQGTS
jgi:uncharacterized protein YndB with AHSA1/START domain